MKACVLVALILAAILLSVKPRMEIAMGIPRIEDARFFQDIEPDEQV